MSTFAYIGQALSADAFRAYVATYDFGSVLPDFVVIHNTANPDASWAPLSSDPNIKWDRNEASLSADQIKAKRKLQLDAIKTYYAGLGWTSGPHLFIDERWIWLFTPMYDVGTHAKEGNSYHDAAGHLHYSLGIETVGYFGKVGWPPSMQELLRVALLALRDRLHTFDIVYKRAPAHRPDLHVGSIALHSDFNKPECPGAAITPDYVIGVLSGTTKRPEQRRYRTKYRAAVYEQQRGRGPLWGALEAGTVIEADRDDYPEGTVHDASGKGFLVKEDLEAL